MIDRVNAVEVNPGHNVVSDALHRETVGALCRVWDSTRGTASIPQLAKRLRKPAGISEVEKTYGPIDRQELAKWLDDVKEVEDSEELEALETVRHMYLAHDADKNHPYKGNARVAVYGDERKILDASIPIAEFANRMMGQRDYTFGDQRKAWIEESEKFWDSVARPVKKPENT